MLQLTNNTAPSLKPCSVAISLGVLLLDFIVGLAPFLNKYPIISSKSVIVFVSLKR